MSAQIDPELEYLLEHIAEGELLDVTLLLSASADPQALLARLGLADASDLTTSYIERVRVLSVRASAPVIRRLVAEPEVETASAALSDE